MNRRRLRPAAVAVLGLLVLTACGSRADDALRSQARQAQLSQGGGGGNGGTGSGGDASGGTAGGSGTTGTGTAGGGTTGATGAAGTTGSTGTAGSGGTTGTGSFSGDNGGTTDVGVTGKALSVGIVADLSGPIPGLFQGAVRGAQAYLSKVNAEGGIYGRQLKLDVGDSQLDCGQYKSQTQDKVDKDFALIGSFSLYDSCGVDVLKAHPGVADIHSALSTSAQNIDNNFSVAPLGGGWRTGPLSYYKKKFGDSWQHIGSVYAAIGGGRETWVAAKAVIQKPGSSWQGHVDRDASYQPTDTDFTAEIIRMQQAGVKMLYLIAVNNAGAANVLHAVRQQASTRGWPVVIGGPAYDAAFLKQAESDLKMTGAGPTFEDQQYALFFNSGDAQAIPAVKDFQTWYGRVSGGATPDLFAAYGWSSAQLFVQALKAAGPKATRKSLFTALKKVTRFDAGGLLVPANPAQNKPGNCWVFTEAVNAQWVRKDSPKGAFRCDGPYVRAS
ncbi:MAG TPA: ABC transporter substrate-binding protein [Mycobacteriales bacterium]|nr:ABC transporter substrate-binding protein [Mycobacteriales bacterium]